MSEEKIIKVAVPIKTSFETEEILGCVIFGLDYSAEFHGIEGADEKYQSILEGLGYQNDVRAVEVMGLVASGILFHINADIDSEMASTYLHNLTAIIGEIDELNDEVSRTSNNEVYDRLVRESAGQEFKDDVISGITFDTDIPCDCGYCSGNENEIPLKPSIENYFTGLGYSKEEIQEMAKKAVSNGLATVNDLGKSVKDTVTGGISKLSDVVSLAKDRVSHVTKEEVVMHLLDVEPEKTDSSIIFNINIPVIGLDESKISVSYDNESSISVSLDNADDTRIVGTRVPINKVNVDCVLNLPDWTFEVDGYRYDTPDDIRSSLENGILTVSVEYLSDTPVASGSTENAKEHMKIKINKR